MTGRAERTENDSPIAALRGMLERLRDGQEDLPRASAWVMLDFLASIERGTVPRSVADNLAEALEAAATRPDPFWPSDVRTALDAYRAAYPREERPDGS